MPRMTAVIVAVEIKDITLGDKLVTDVMGYKGKTLIPRGTTISARELNWFKKKMAEAKPKLAAEKYITNTKAKGHIMSKDGKMLVERGKMITEDALSPLLKEGFTAVETMEAGQIMHYRKAEWSGAFHICDFNPIVQVERQQLVNDDGSVAKTHANKTTAITAK